MAFIYTDPNTAGPFASFQVKDIVCKAVKLTSANFTTTNVDTLVAVLPADASIIGFDMWIKTQLAGGGITAASISIGSSSGGTQYASALSSFGTAGAFSVLTPVTAIFQAYNPPMTTDYPIYIRGTATTGNPTSGEIYLLIKYVR